MSTGKPCELTVIAICHSNVACSNGLAVAMKKFRRFSAHVGALRCANAAVEPGNKYSRSSARNHPIIDRAQYDGSNPSKQHAESDAVDPDSG
jgi:hypothetical protein